MPLANVTAILQLLPLSVAFVGALFFRERMGWRRTLAISIGFSGMFLIVRPGAEGFGVYTYYTNRPNN
jgi:S-adenosylmethionine uptake transporter